jgi:hypothetical protein
MNLALLDYYLTSAGSLSYVKPDSPTPRVPFWDTLNGKKVQVMIL